MDVNSSVKIILANYLEALPERGETWGKKKGGGLLLGRRLFFTQGARRVFEQCLSSG